MTKPEDELPGKPVFMGDEYEAFKLQIRRLDTGDRSGEVNFLIRNKQNNLRYLLLYCFVEQPGEIFRMSFWINNKVLLPTSEVATTERLIDEEKAAYWVMDFCEQYLKKNYTLVSEIMQQK